MTGEQLDRVESYWQRIHKLRDLQCEQIRGIALRKRERDTAEQEMTRLMRAYRATDLELKQVASQMHAEGILEPEH